MAREDITRTAKTRNLHKSIYTHSVLIIPQHQSDLSILIMPPPFYEDLTAVSKLEQVAFPLKYLVKVARIPIETNLIS